MRHGVIAGGGGLCNRSPFWRRHARGRCNRSPFWRRQDCGGGLRMWAGPESGRMLLGTAIRGETPYSYLSHGAARAPRPTQGCSRRRRRVTAVGQGLPTDRASSLYHAQLTVQSILAGHVLSWCARAQEKSLNPRNRAILGCLSILFCGFDHAGARTNLATSPATRLSSHCCRTSVIQFFLRLTTWHVRRCWIT